METFFEILFEFVVVGIFIFPGAGYRWFISRLWNSNKTYKDFRNDDAYLNGIVGVLVTALIIITIVVIK